MTLPFSKASSTAALIVRLLCDWGCMMADLFLCLVSVGAAAAVLVGWVVGDGRRAAARRREWRRMDRARAAWRARVLGAAYGR